MLENTLQKYLFLCFKFTFETSKEDPRWETKTQEEGDEQTTDYCLVALSMIKI
jgi:hypothetical protein